MAPQATRTATPSRQIVYTASRQAFIHLLHLLGHLTRRGGEPQSARRLAALASRAMRLSRLGTSIRGSTAWMTLTPSVAAACCRAQASSLAVRARWALMFVSPGASADSSAAQSQRAMSL